jgi:pimeloyl-ACP methyl ester carboxylesterase
MSNPLWWAEMWNTLRSDPALRRNFQFWVYLYNTGNPLTYSAANFRDSVSDLVHTLDPAGRDPALRQMVIVGHSQGGLLTKLAVTDTGDALWRAVGGASLDTSKLTVAQAAFVRRVTVFAPLPFVHRVVFISTPHRGSYLVKSWVQVLARHFIHLPGEVVSVSTDLLLLWAPKSALAKLRGEIPTSIDSMSPKNRLLLALADLPVAPGVASHSIIAIRGNGPPATGDDGVVKYPSAHVDYAESEFIVRSRHSCQGNPFTIEEVRRILLEHLHTLPAGTLPPSRTDTP